METQLEEEIQETPVQPTIMRRVDSEPPIQHITSLSATPNVGRDGMLPQVVASKGFAQMFGLDIRAAL